LGVGIGIPIEEGIECSLKFGLQFEFLPPVFEEGIGGCGWDDWGGAEGGT